MSLRVIGDVHGQIDCALKRGASSYLELIAKCEYSVQLGDMGNAETYAELVAHVDVTNHRFFGGNHDQYDSLPPHSLGDYGMREIGSVPFFFVRGAKSIDKKDLLEHGKRLGRKLWFEEEELSESIHDKIATAFSIAKPDVMLTHECPESISPFILEHVQSHSYVFQRSRHLTSRTGLFLESLLQIHRPKIWLFGHYHHNWRYVDDDVAFQCIGELSYLDL